MSIIQLHPTLLYPPAVYRAVGRATILCKLDNDGAEFFFAGCMQILDELGMSMSDIED